MAGCSESILESFARLAQLAAQSLQVPLALVALLAEGRLTIVTSPAYLETGGELGSLGRRLCEHVLHSGQPLVLTEIREEAWVAGAACDPGGGGLAFAGLPLIASPNQVLGALCVGDVAPRGWSEYQLGMLRTIASAAVTELELRLERAERKRQEVELRGRVLGPPPCVAVESGVRRTLSCEADLLTALLETVPDLIYFKDRESRFLRVNRAQADALGLTDPEEALGKCDGDFFPPELADRYFADEQSVLTNGEAIVDRIEPLKQRDGRLRWLLTTKVPLKGPEGRIVGLAGISRDITQQHQSEERLMHVLTGTRCLLWVADVHEEEASPEGLLWDLMVFNEEAAEQFLPVRQVGTSYSTSWRASKLCEDRPRIMRIGGEALRSGAPGYSQEYRCRRTDGRIVWLHEDARIECLEPGRWRVVGVCTDITERKRAEERNVTFQAMGQLLNEARTPQEAARVVLSMAGELLGWDACWLKLVEPVDGQHTMVQIDVIEGERVDVPPATPDRFSSLAFRALQQGSFLIADEPDDEPPSMTGEYSPFGDRSRASVSLMCVPIRNGDRAVGAMSIQSYTFHKYSDEDLGVLQAMADYCAGALVRTQAEAAREKLQQQLVQAQKMEAIGRLAGGIAHDFNNMLAVINGYSLLLLPSTEPESRLREGLEEILLAGERAADLTRQLLAFGRKQMLNAGEQNLNQIVIGFERLLRRLVGEDVTVTLQLHPDLGPVWADRVQLEQVLMNLAVNARGAMPLGGGLTVDTRNCDVGDDARLHPGVPPGAYVVLSVADTGCGMSPELLAQIWEPFFTTKPLGEGSGLGLATTYGIIKQSGGYVAVQSAPGVGSTFRIYLPRADRDGNVTVDAGAVSRPANSICETVLVVEDDDLVRRLVKTVLQSEDFHVLEARHGEEALLIAANHPLPIHVMITDISIPGKMSGRVLSEQLKVSRPDLKTLYMSGYSDEEVTRHGVKLTGATFIQKPFAPHTLVVKLREFLADQRG